MLVLGRKEGQQIMLDNNIVIKVVSVQGTYVKVGIEAPRSVKVYREEICPELAEHHTSTT
jgi:carbon storage regulator